MPREPAKSKKKSSHSVAPSFKARLAKLRAALRNRSIEALLITNPNDIHYLTGFHGDDSWFIVTPRRPILISDFRFQEELDEITGVRLLLRAGAIQDAAMDPLSRYDSVGVQAEYLTVATRKTLARFLGARRLKDTTGLVNALRVIKDEFEIKQIKKAVRIQERALLAMLDRVGPGDAERDIAAELEHQMKSLGAEGPSFDSIVAARTNGSKPHYRPSKTKAANNQPLLIDWGAKVGGYCSDMTRTLSFGRWPNPLAEVYTIVLDAQQAAIDAIAPGVCCAAVDAVARDLITKAGYGNEFGHGLGHGIGLDIHENPRLSRYSTDVLQPGMVVTVEPGVYLPGVGGVRIEDDILVTDRGHRNLCSLPNTIQWSTR